MFFPAERYESHAEITIWQSNNLFPFSRSHPKYNTLPCQRYRVYLSIVMKII